MSFRYSIGDVVVVAPQALWWRSLRGKQEPAQATVMGRKPENENFPYYHLLFAPPPPPRVHSVPWLSEHDILGLARDYKPATHLYFTIITYGPLFFLRTPIKRPQWRALLKGLTPILRHYDIKLRDVQIEGRNGTENADEADLVKTLQHAFAGDAATVRKFGLLDWRGDAAVLIREPATG